MTTKPISIAALAALSLIGCRDHRDLDFDRLGDHDILAPLAVAGRQGHQRRRSVSRPHLRPLGILDSAAQPWPAGTFANLGGGGHGSAWVERSEIYDLVRDAKITGFAIVSGDRHSFWAGYASAQLPPGKFEPVGLSFVGGSLTSPGAMEAYEHRLPKDLPLRALYLADRPDGSKPDWTFNMLLKHGVRSCLEYAKTFDLERARAFSNPALAPHLEFVDMGGHGYATVRLSSDEMRTEFDSDRAAVPLMRGTSLNDACSRGPTRGSW